MIWEGVVSKMMGTACTVCTQQLQYPLFKSCMCGTARNFDSIVTIICICLDTDPKSNEFKFGPFGIYSVRGKRNISLDGSTYCLPWSPNVDEVHSRFVEVVFKNILPTSPSWSFIFIRFSVFFNWKTLNNFSGKLRFPDRYLQKTVFQQRMHVHTSS